MPTPDRSEASGGALAGLDLLDHHCHGVVPADLDRQEFEALLTEAPAAGRRDRFASMLGLAVRRWCAPVLDLEPHAEPDDYLRRRAELGWAEVTSRLLRASGARTWLVDTGFTPGELTSPGELASLGGGHAYPVVRLESVAESVGRAGGGVGSGATDRLTSGGGSGPSRATDWADAVERAVREELVGAVGMKTVVAYRSGLAVPAAPPSSAAVAHGAGQWLRRRDAGESTRIADPVLGAWLVHLGTRLSAELGVPLQVHTGFGDPDVRLTTADPSLLTDLLVASEPTGARFMLLHCWPYMREAGYLANVFDHVYVDVGLAVPHTGARAREVLAELLELAPFASVCFSSDGYGLPELHYLGALLWGRALGRLVDEWVSADVLPAHEVDSFVSGLADGNARSVYPLPPPG